MANRKRAIPQYGTVTLNGLDYYRTRVQDADGKLVALYARTPEELYDKELNALEQIDNDTFCRKSPTVAEYCEKWLLMQSVHVRATTMTDYTSKVRRHIIKELGDMRMADVTLDDIQLALVPVSKKSASVYKSVVVLYKSIFRAAKESRIIENNPTVYLTSKGGGVPQKISTHAPRTGSDAEPPARAASRQQFQPTLPARGATRSRRKSTSRPRFQPTLPARGATPKGGDHDRPGPYFNPRSPHGERRAASRRQSRQQFISTHAPRTGSDTFALQNRALFMQFQPTLPARGATR